MRWAVTVLVVLLVAPPSASADHCTSTDGSVDLFFAQLGEERTDCHEADDSGSIRSSETSHASRTYVEDERFTGWGLAYERESTTWNLTNDDANFSRECAEEENEVEVATRGSEVEAFDRSEDCSGHNAFGPESVASRSRGVEATSGPFETEVEVQRWQWMHRFPGSQRDDRETSVTVGFVSIEAASTHSNGFPRSCTVEGFPQAPPVCDAFFWGLMPVAPLP